MIYLILKIFGYLLVALLTGFASGWLYRNLMAMKKDELLQSSLNDVRAKLPQFESLLRGRDQQIESLKENLDERGRNLSELMDEAKANQQALRIKTRELDRLTSKGSDSVLEDADIETPSSSTEVIDGPVVQEVAPADTQRKEILEAEINQLKKDLEAAVEATRQAQANALADITDADSGSRQVQELEARLRQQAVDFERLGKSLKQERRKVVELERERELQHKSLQVLHQQLEFERDRGQQSANG